MEWQYSVIDTLNSHPSEPTIFSISPSNKSRDTQSQLLNHVLRTQNFPASGFVILRNCLSSWLKMMAIIIIAFSHNSEQSRKEEERQRWLQLGLGLLTLFPGFFLRCLTTCSILISQQHQNNSQSAQAEGQHRQL